MRWFETAPNGPQWCKTMLTSGTKEVQNGLRCFKNSQNSMTNSFKEKKVGVTHGKKGIWPQKPNRNEVFGVKLPLFDLQRPFFSWGCKELSKEGIWRIKSGCHPWKHGYLTPKMVKLWPNRRWWTITPSRKVKKQPRLVPNVLWDDSKPLLMVHNRAKLCFN